MQHRGPDDEGYVLFGSDFVESYFGDDTPEAGNEEGTTIPGYPFRHIRSAFGKKTYAAMGHRRLSIVDLSPRGHQPMTTPDRRWWIIYNGEIYNYREIANLLHKKGVSLQSETDTEVILKSYVLWKESCLQRFNGMFAFAIWDNLERSLFCARDRIGIKPFYYTIANGQFIFASDIKTIIASGLYRPEPDMEGLYLAMAFGIAPRPKTAFKNVFALEQAHWMRVHSDGSIRKERYWTIPVGTQNHSMSEDDAAHLLEEQLTTSIRLRLVADVPVGTFMSGGIDSTTISAIASTVHPGIKAFTLAYEDNAAEMNEVDQARATAAMHPMRHIIHQVKYKYLLDNLDEVVSCYEEPAFGLAANFTIARIVRNNNVTVVLNGLGGDELFSGYSYYRWAKRWKILNHASEIFALIGKLVAKRNPKLSTLLETKRFEYLHTILFSKINEIDRKLLFGKSFQQNFDTLEWIHNKYVGDIEFEDAMEAMSYLDIVNYIGNHHVHRLDQFSMACSVEARLPLLDHNLIKVAFKIPSELKIKKGKQKYILRKVARKYIARSCLEMPKKGFGMPLAQWVSAELKSFVYVKVKLLQKRQVFNSDQINRWITEYENKKRPAAHIWHLVLVQLWFEKFIDR